MCLKPDCIACNTNLAVSSPLPLAPYTMLPICARCFVVDVPIISSGFISSLHGFTLFKRRINTRASGMTSRTVLWRRQGDIFLCLSLGGRDATVTRGMRAFCPSSLFMTTAALCLLICASSLLRSIYLHVDSDHGSDARWIGKEDVYVGTLTTLCTVRLCTRQEPGCDGAPLLFYLLCCLCRHDLLGVRRQLLLRLHYLKWHTTNREDGGADRGISSSVNRRGIMVWDTTKYQHPVVHHRQT